MEHEKLTVDDVVGGLLVVGMLFFLMAI